MKYVLDTNIIRTLCFHLPKKGIIFKKYGMHLKYVWFGAQKSGKVIFKSRTKAKYKKMQDKTVSLKLTNDVLFLSMMFYCSDFRQ